MKLTFLPLILTDLWNQLFLAAVYAGHIRLLVL